MRFFSLKVDHEIELRQFLPDHAGRLFDLVDANRERLRAWLPWVDSTVHAGDTLAFIRGQMRAYAGGSGLAAGIWFEEELAGAIGMHDINRVVGCTSIGYWISREFEGRGIMTRSCRALIDHAFRAWGFNRIEIRCAVGNLRSQRIPERLGFLREGTAREVERVGLDLLDLVIYGMLLRDWLSERDER